MKKYYLKGISENYGPYSVEDLKLKQVDPSTLVSIHENEEWIPASKDQELATLVEAQTRNPIHWGDFKDDGMKPNGFRQYSSILWDIPSGQSWENTCAITPATIRGHYFPRPTRCVNNGSMWGEFDYPEPRTYYNNWMNVHITEFWINSPGDVYGRLEDVSDWLTQINTRIGKPKLLAGLNISLLSKMPSNNAGESLNPEIRMSRIGCTDSSGMFNFERPFSHEVGHIFHQRLGIQYSGKPVLQNGIATTAAAQQILNEYRNLRSIDYTSRTPEVERFAEDFKWFFGSNGAINDPTHQDDFYLGTARAPYDVKGLKEFFMNCNF
jgi:hypothetical protein